MDILYRSGAPTASEAMVDTFFDGSAAKIVAVVPGGEAARLSEEALERIAAMIARARHWKA